MCAAQDPDRWLKGPPPHVGWWLTMTQRGQLRWRWWDGQGWSLGTLAIHSARFASAQTRQKPLPHLTFKWCYFWPHHARVARINPATGEVTGRGPVKAQRSKGSAP